MVDDSTGGTLGGVGDDSGIDRDLVDLGLTEAELDALLATDEPVAGLTSLLEPDHDMLRRVTQGVEQRLADRAAAAVVADLVGLGWFTLRAVLGDQNAL